MYIKQVNIEHIKCIDSLTLEFANEAAGWHVLLGDNGAGKSTVLKMIVVTLLGEQLAYAMQASYSQWVRKSYVEGHCSVDFITENLKDSGRTSNRSITINAQKKLEGDDDLESFYDLAISVGESEGDIFAKGVFSAAFGSYRKIGERLGMVQESGLEKKVDAHISLFKDNYSLVSAYKWLTELHLQTLEGRLDKQFIEKLKSFFNKTGLLPDGVAIHEISSRGITFNDLSGNEIDVLEMSDGYKSVFMLVSEIIRQMTVQFGIENVMKYGLDENFAFQIPGVVMIDEVDIHLHPSWQVRIGNWFKKRFPKIQFIVTTHSPLICQSAEGGSIWKIEASENGSIAKKIEGQDFQRLVFGNLLDAMSTDAFGKHVTRSEASQRKLERLAVLNIKSIRKGLSEDEDAELRALKSILPTEDYSI